MRICCNGTGGGGNGGPAKCEAKASLKRLVKEAIPNPWPNHVVNIGQRLAIGSANHAASYSQCVARELGSGPDFRATNVLPEGVFSIRVAFIFGSFDGDFAIGCGRYPAGTLNTRQWLGRWNQAQHGKQGVVADKLLRGVRPGPDANIAEVMSRAL